MAHLGEYIEQIYREQKKAIIEELNKLKTEIEKLEYDDFDCNLVLPAWEVYDIIDNHIKELKGGKECFTILKIYFEKLKP